MDICGLKFLDCMCRTCMLEVSEEFPHDSNTSAGLQWHSILDTIEKCGSLLITELLANAVPQIKDQLTDDLPKKICAKCLEQLQNIYRFQQMCLKSEQQMRVLIASLLEEDEEQINEFTSASTLEETIPTSIVEVKVENCKDLEVDVGVYVLNEPCSDDEANLVFINDEELLSTITLKDEVAIEAEVTQENLTTFTFINNTKVTTTTTVADNRMSEKEFLSERKKAFASVNTLPEITKVNLENPKEVSTTTRTDERPHVCQDCGKSFKRLRNLAQHRLVHTKDKAHECNEKPHKCDVCEKRFGRIQTLKVHMRTHTGEKPHKCKYCERAFARFVERSRHLRSHLGKNIHRCKFCPLAFPSYAEMRLHLTSHTHEDPETRERNLKALQEEEAKVKQKILKEKTEGQSTAEQWQQKLSKNEIEQQTTEYLTEHRSLHGDVRPFECPYCPKKFRLYSTLYGHKITHQEIKQYVCDLCGDGFKRKETLTVHMRRHNGVKPYKCVYCNKRFTTSSHLTRHLRNHTGEKPYKCKYCKHDFLSYGSLACHLRTHLGVNVYRCELCPSAFPSATELRKHFAMHKNEDDRTRERNMKALKKELAKLEIKLRKNEKKKKVLGVYKCKYCERVYHFRASLTRHLRTHIGEQLYKCEFCPLAFSSDAEMQLHLAKHENEDQETREQKRKALKEELTKLEIELTNKKKQVVQVQKCKYCERSFTSQKNLMSHLRTHLGDNVYRCKLCPLAFSYASELREHFFTHRNDDEEMRERNMKAFKEVETKLERKLHKNKKQKLPVHKCKYCERVYGYRGSLARHLRSHSGKNVFRCELCPLAFPSTSDLRKHFATHEKHEKEDEETHEGNMTH